MATTNQTPNDIDFSVYASPTRMDAQHGVVIAAQLAVSAPPDREPRRRDQLARVTARAERVTTVLIARGRGTAGGLRPILAAFDAAYGALHGRLQSAAKLPARIGDAAVRATRLLDVVLVDGVAFLVNDAETKYAESARRLLVIDEHRLEAEIDHVAGAGFLTAVREAHAALGEAIGVGATPMRYARAELQSAVSELALAIVDYSLRIASQVDRHDAASVARFREAIMPLDRFRAERASSPSSEDEDLVEVTPIAPSPASPTPVAGPTPTPITPFPSPFITE